MSASDSQRAAQPAAADRAVRDQRDPELAQRRDDAVVLVIAAEQRVLTLIRGDRMNRRRAPHFGSFRLGEAERADFPRRDELGHRADRLLDRDVGVDAVLVVEVDRVDAESLERGFARRAHVLRRAADAGALPVGRAQHPELRRQDDAVAVLTDEGPEQRLVVADAVGVGGVVERDPELERTIQRSQRFGVLGRTVSARHPHAAQTERGNGRAAVGKLSSLHPGTFSAGRSGSSSRRRAPKMPEAYRRRRPIACAMTNAQIGKRITENSHGLSEPLGRRTAMNASAT